MENESRFSQWSSRLGEQLNEQVWFQQLKAKWDEQDPQSQTYLKAALAGIVVLSLLFVVFSSIWSVHRLKNELDEKTELLGMVQSANDEIRKLRNANPGGAQSGGSEQGAWPAFFESTGSQAGIDKESLTVEGEKAGGGGDMAMETLFDINLKKVNIKQVVRYAFRLENAPRPVKLRTLTIDTINDNSGYLNATLSVSAFSLKPQP